MGEERTQSDRRLFHIMIGALGLFVIVVMIIAILPRRTAPADPSLQTAVITEEITIPAPAPAGSHAAGSDEERAALFADLELALTKDSLARAQLLLKEAQATYPADPETTRLAGRVAALESAQALQQNQFLVFLDSAERAAENRQWSLAVNNYEAALAIKPAAIIQGRLDEARYAMHLQRAEEYLRKENQVSARSSLEQARAIRPDAALEARIRDLDAGITASQEEARQAAAFEAQRNRAEDGLARGAFAEALSCCAAAAGLAVTDQQKKYIADLELVCRTREGEANRRTAFEKLVRTARLAERSGDQVRALELYEQAYAGIADPAVAGRIADLKAIVPAAVITDAAGGTMVLIPEGPFTRGGPEESADDCRPARELVLSAFYIDTREVTNAQYEQFAPGHKRSVASPADDMPAVNVTWNDAMRYCAWRGALNKARYRLPTEAEWEKAARGGQGFAYAWGPAYDLTRGCTGLHSRSAMAAGSFDPNPFGMYDLSGNVWEWCLDWYGPDYYAAAPDRDPQGPASGTHRVVRGGSFRFASDACTTYTRNAELPDKEVFDIGFRTVRMTGKE